MSSPSNSTVAAALERIAELLERDGVEPTPVAAYRRAARLIAAEPQPVALRVDTDGVEGLHALGIGYLISGLITDWVRSGELPLLERLERRHDPEARLRTVPGIGPRLAHEVNALGITSVDALAEAASEGRLENVCGFGPKRIALLRTLRRSSRPPQRAEAPVQLDLIAG
ncbi:MAG: hypothetical protein JNK82_07425 [Myxococcaceae bacterium]|nr:hypothetical protein [Myxococcaceae bacterium]